MDSSGSGGSGFTIQYVGTPNLSYAAFFLFRSTSAVLGERISRDTYFRTYDQPPLPAPLDLARHVVFGAVAYARKLGFEPHPDFDKCVGHLGAPWEGTSDITFGRDGRPTYIEGPHDNAARVIRTLRRSVGRGKFDYLSQIG